MKPKTFKRKSKRTMRAAKHLTAKEAIGKLTHDQDVYILTFGKFSLIDALVAIVDQIGPADVVLSTWTAADAHLERTFELMNDSSIRSTRLIVDPSFETRQPGYCSHMRSRFGDNCIRTIRNHSKFMLISNDDWHIVIRTSMNLNENPRLENIEISENQDFFNWFLIIVDDIFRDVKPGITRTGLPGLPHVPDNYPFKQCHAEPIKRENVNEATYTHTLKEL